MKNSILWIVGTLTLMPFCASAGAELSAQECAHLERIIQGSVPTGALASQIHIMNVMDAAIRATDGGCPKALEGLSAAQVQLQRQSFVDAYNTAKANCEKISASPDKDCN